MNGQEYLAVELVAGSAAVVVAVAAIAYRALARRAPMAAARTRPAALLAALLIVWLGAALGTSLSGLYHVGGGSSPTIELGLAIPIIIGIALYRQWGDLRWVVDAVPQQWIVGIQVFRLEGIVFLLLLANGQLPGVFAMPAGCGDVAVGLLAPVAAILYANKVRGAPAVVAAWNLLGLLDLSVAITTGFLSSPSKLQMLALGHPNQLITQFPLVMIPVFLVPLAILLHLASLAKLRKPRERELPSSARVSPA